MKGTKIDERFFDSTRGQIVMLLRGAARTVDELSKELDLTDNAVRAHLATLERDGLVRQRGVRRGFRKPHYTYTLSPEAEGLFPKAYDVLLNRLIHVLKLRLPPESLREVFSEVGHSLATNERAAVSGKGLEGRARSAVKALAQLGGKAEVEREGDALFIRSESCPLAAAVTEHPEVCRLAEALIARIVGAEVQEQCDRRESPKCRFAIAEKDEGVHPSVKGAGG